MKKYIFTVFAVAAVLSSCSKSLEPNGDINSGAKAITSIGASTEISTRAVVNSSDDTKVNWETGDQLGVLGANDKSEAKKFAYTLDGDGGSTTGTFKNENSDIETISAVMYPYQENATWADSKLTCEIPSVQTAVKGSFDKAAAVMYSIGNTTDVQLKFAVNFLKVTVSETNVHAISISSTTTALSGNMEIATSLGVTAATSGSLKSVTLTAGKGNVLAAGDYYIAVKAGDIDNPTISYVYLDQTNHTATEKSKASSGTLSFAEGKNVKPINVDFTEGTVTTRNAVQLWPDGPYFAEYNVGASSAGDIGSTMTFTDATKAGAEYEWGANWCTPSKDQQLDELQKSATSGGSTKVDCGYIQENGVYGFKFTGKETGYTSNSVFFPAQNGNSLDGSAYYWSGTASGSSAWDMYLYYDDGDWYSRWDEVDQDGQDYECLVRPVLKN